MQLQRGPCPVWKRSSGLLSMSQPSPSQGPSPSLPPSPPSLPPYLSLRLVIIVHGPHHPATQATPSDTTACPLVTWARPQPDRSATVFAAIPVSGRWSELLNLVLSVDGVAPCRLSYSGRLAFNEIGDGGAGAVAAAAGTMPCLDALEWVTSCPFQESHSRSTPFPLSSPLSFSPLPLLSLSSPHCPFPLLFSCSRSQFKHFHYPSLLSPRVSLFDDPALHAAASATRGRGLSWRWCRRTRS